MRSLHESLAYVRNKLRGLGIVKPADPARITAVERGFAKSWRIVLDAEQSTEIPCKYSFHWTGRHWERSLGPNDHVYLELENAERFIKEELEEMVRLVPSSG